MDKKQMISRLGSVGAQEKITALQELFNLPNKIIEIDLIQAIDKLRQDGDIGVKFWAKRAFNKYSSDAIKPKTTENKDDGEVSAKLPVSILLRKLETVESSFISIDVIKKLCESRLQEALPPLISHLGKTKDVIQISFLVKSLGIYYSSNDLLPTLMPYLKHPDDRVVANCIEGLEGLNNPKTLALFSQLLNHSSNRVRSNAAKGISKFDFETTFNVISAMLQKKDMPHFVISACYTVREIKDPRFLPLFKDLLDDDLTFIDALQAVEAIGNDEALKLLENIYNGSDDDDKKQIIEEVMNRMIKALENKGGIMGWFSKNLGNRQ